MCVSGKNVTGDKTSFSSRLLIILSFSSNSAEDERLSCQISYSELERVEVRVLIRVLVSGVTRKF